MPCVFSNDDVQEADSWGIMAMPHEIAYGLQSERQLAVSCMPHSMKGRVKGFHLSSF